MSDKFPGGLITAGAPAGFSVAFSATGDDLRTGTMTALGSDFTVECWVYPTSFANYNVIWDSRTADGSSAGFAYGLDANAKVYLYSSGAFQITTTTALVSNRWTHLALVRSGSGSGNCKIYINGVADATTGTYTTSFTNTAAYIGNDFDGTGANFAGYVSNLRAVTSAIYTTTFTPPTQLFPIANTVLLTCQSPAFIDNSSSAVSITATGAVVSNFTPFAGYTGFNPALGAAAGGVWTLDEAAYYQQNRLWPIYDPYFNQTTLMLHGNGTNGAQNNTFLDSSANNFTITRNGNTTQGSFSPFSQTGWSNYFDGASALTIPNSTAFNFDSGDFTVEAWVYFTSLASTKYTIMGKWGSGLAWIFQTDSTTKVGVALANNGSYSSGNYFSEAGLVTGQWMHLAVSRSGTTLRVFKNGTLIGTFTSSENITTTETFYVARNGGASQDFSGYISNARVVKGTAVYTSSFTPSTTPLTAITGTSVLTCQTNRFNDNSANNFAISTAGTPSSQAFSPFVPAYITPTTYSNFFDGSTGYLSFTSSAGIAFGTGDYTVEAWVNLTTSSTYQTLFGSATSDALMFNIYSMNSVVIQTSGTNIFATFSGATFATNTWYHVAVSRSSGTVKAFVNGVQYGSTITSNTTNYAQPTTNTIGSNAASQYFGGCLSSLRLVKGTAVYTANFTPPTEPLTNITNTSLLTCQNSTFIDNSSSPFTLTSTGSVKPVTSPTPFPAKVDTTTLNSAYSTSLIGGSGYFDGTGDYLTLPANAAFNFNTGNFTLETWLYMPSFSTFQEIFSQGSGNFQGIGIYTTTSGKVHLDLGNGSSWYANAETTNSLKLNSWNHVAIVRQSTTYTIYLNGASDATTTTATFPSDASGSSSYIAVYGPLTSQLFNGYMSGFRIVKGSAVYTSNFAPPTAPPTNITNTSLLTNFTNGAIFDNTAKNVLETVGTAAISTTQSKYGGSSMYFDGSTSSWLLIPFSRNLDISTGAPDWTLECWGYVVSFANSPYFFNKGGVAASTYTNYSFSMNSSGVVFCTLGNNGAETSYSFGTCLVNTWYHFAATRQGSTIRTFLNGVLVTSQSIATTMTDNGEALYVGCLKNLTSNVLNGYVDDLRITKGYARYITNFTPPTSQLQDQ